MKDTVVFPSIPQYKHFFRQFLQKYRCNENCVFHKINSETDAIPF